MRTNAPDNNPTHHPTICDTPDIVGNIVGILSGDTHTPSEQSATGFAGHPAHTVKCRVHDCEVR